MLADEHLFPRREKIIAFPAEQNNHMTFLVVELIIADIIISRIVVSPPSTMRCIFSVQRLAPLIQIVPICIVAIVFSFELRPVVVPTLISASRAPLVIVSSIIAVRLVRRRAPGLVARVFLLNETILAQRISKSWTRSPVVTARRIPDPVGWRGNRHQVLFEG